MIQFISQLQDLIQSKQGLRIGFIINILLIILLIMSLYKMIVIFKPKQIEPLSFTTVKQTEIPDIASWHLFGFDQTNLSEIEGLPNTTLQLQLVGVFVTTPAEESYAIITTKDGKEQMYKVGDVISDRIKIYQILPDHVILQDHDQLASLSLPTKSLIFGEMPEQLTLPSHG